MKKIIPILLIIVLIGSVGFSQDIKPSVKGEKAMLFGFSGLGFLGVLEYQGGFGYKRFISDKMAVRTGLMLDYNKTKVPFVEAVGIVGEDGYDKTFGMGLEIVVEIHKGSGKIDPYYGIGGSFFRTTTEFAPVRTGPAGVPLVQWTLKNDLNGDAGTNFGAFFLMGLEYFLTDNLSLAGEYHFGFDYTAALTEEFDPGDGVTPIVETSGGSSTGFGISSSGLLTLAIYK